MLNLARAVQGIGGAMMFATSLALIARHSAASDRGTAFGVFGAVDGAAVAVGPVLGGVITSGIGWKWIFFVNVPIGIAAVFVTLTKVGESRDPNARGVDWGGLVTFSGGLFLLVYALVQGNNKGWGSTEIVTLLAGAVCCWCCSWSSSSVQSRPMLDLALFRRPAFTGANIVAFILASSYFAMFLYLTLYIQDVLAYIALPGRPALPADHAAVVHRGSDRGPPQRARAGAPAARPRPGAGRRRPAHDDGASLDLDMDLTDRAVHPRRAPASAWSTRRWPRPPSA